MYVEALNFYIDKLSEYSIENGIQYIVFAENSGFDGGLINMLKKHPNVVIEYLNIGTGDFKIHLGKGYNEYLLLQKAIKQSEVIRKCGCFFKLTGRLKVLNITSLLGECYKRNEKIGGGLSFLADCKDHKVYEWLGMPINGHMGECRYWFASSVFFEQMIFPKCDQLNDYSTPRYLAEDMMLPESTRLVYKTLKGLMDSLNTKTFINLDSIQDYNSRKIAREQLDAIFGKAIKRIFADPNTDTMGLINEITRGIIKLQNEYKVTVPYSDHQMLGKTHTTIGSQLNKYIARS
jgi:hypothetical protein